MYLLQYCLLMMLVIIGKYFYKNGCGRWFKTSCQSNKRCSSSRNASHNSAQALGIFVITYWILQRFGLRCLFLQTSYLRRNSNRGLPIPHLGWILGDCLPPDYEFRIKAPKVQQVPGSHNRVAGSCIPIVIIVTIILLWPVTILSQRMPGQRTRQTGIETGRLYLSSSNSKLCIEGMEALFLER